MKPGIIFSDLFYLTIGHSEISRLGNMFLWVHLQQKMVFPQFLHGSWLLMPLKEARFLFQIRTQNLFHISEKKIIFLMILTLVFGWKQKKWKLLSKLWRQTLNIFTGAVPSNLPITQWLAAICNQVICLDQAPFLVNRRNSLAVYLNWLGEEETKLTCQMEKQESLSKTEIRLLWLGTPWKMERRSVLENVLERFFLPFPNLSIIDSVNWTIKFINYKRINSNGRVKEKTPRIDL